MKLRVPLELTLACASLIALQGYAQTDSGRPRLQKQGTATQLIVDGKPFLAIAGELGNNTATSMENMQPIWSKLLAGNLNSVLAAVPGRRPPVPVPDLARVAGSSAPLPAPPPALPA